MLSDWFTNLTPFYQPMRRKTKTNRALHARFFPRFEQVATDLDWFIELFAPAVIVESNYFGTCY